MPLRDMPRVDPIVKAVQQDAPYVTSKKKRFNKQTPCEEGQDVDEQVASWKIK